MIELTWQLMMGIGLAASAGLRAFLPLLVVGLAGAMELVPLSGSVEWLATPPALIVLTVAVLLEIAADKIPMVDHGLDLAATFVRPVAGATAAVAPLTSLDPLTALVVGIVLGGAVASGVHATKAGARLLSTGGSAGLASPALSVTEDTVSLLGSVTSLLLPVVSFTVVIAVFYLLWRFAWQRGGGRPASAPSIRA